MNGKSMSPLQYAKEIYTTLKTLSKDTGYSVTHLGASFVQSFLSCHVELEEFCSLRLYEYSAAKINTFLTTRRRQKLVRIVNAGVTKEEISSLHQKHRFNAAFSDFVTRDWLYLPDCSAEDIRSFIARNETFLSKPTTGTQGEDIRFIHRETLDVDEFIARHQNHPYLLEAFIQQHPAMAALNESSVNTIRIITLRYKGQVLLIGAGLRCGAAGSHVDNFHNGGSAYPIDIDTGIVTGPGQTLNATSRLLRHPTSHHIMPGFQVPHWETLKARVTEAALIPEHMGYIGWDIAITPDGVDFVECNVSSPGNTIIQLDGNSVYPRITQFMENLRTDL